MALEKGYMIPEERAESEQIEAIKYNQELQEKVSKMNPEDIKNRVLELEDKMRTLDELAGDPAKMEKVYGVNAYQKLEHDFLWTERERALLFIEKPISVATEKIEQIDSALDQAETAVPKEPKKDKEEKPISQKTTVIINREPAHSIDQIKKTDLADIIVEDLKKAPGQLFADIKACWKAAKDELSKFGKKEIWWPNEKFELKMPPKIQATEDIAVKELPVFELENKIRDNYAKQEKEKLAASEKGWDEIGFEIDEKKIEKIRKSREYKEFKKFYENLGKEYRDMPIKPRVGDLAYHFIDKISEAGEPDSEMRKAGELLYNDIMVKKVELPVQEWEWQDRAKLRATEIDYMLLSDITKEQTRVENEIKKLEKKLKNLEPSIVFQTSTDRWAHLAAEHNLQVELQTHKGYLAHLEKALEDEKKGQREIKEFPEPKEMFQMPKEWLDFPEIEIVEEEELATKKAA